MEVQQLTAIPLGTTAGSGYTVTVTVSDEYADTPIARYRCVFDWRVQAQTFVSTQHSDYTALGYGAVETITPNVWVYGWDTPMLPPMVAGTTDTPVHMIRIELSENSACAEGGK